MVTPEAVAEIYSIAQYDVDKVTAPEGFLAAELDQNFGAPFARDALISSIFTHETYKLHPERLELLKPVRDSLVTLVLYQGRVIDDWRDEEPGKIPHELRFGPNRKNQEWLGGLLKAGWPVEQNGNGILSMRYYGSVDSTLLFVGVACDYLSIKEDKEFFNLLDNHIRQAIAWMENYGDSDKDGYIEYSAKNRHALLNQGWKDSSISIKAKEPIALVEIQGYKYAAYVKAAKLYEGVDPELSTHLVQKARVLKENFNKDFWVKEEGFFVHALDGNKNQVKDVVSNVGHLLITGIIDSEKLPQVVARLMQPDILTPYGIRTLSLNSEHFSDVEPRAYHNGGSVWPHDNVMIYYGLKKAGFLKEAVILREVLLDAQYILNKQNVKDGELYIVDRYNHLRPYNGACNPQGWAATGNRFLADPLENAHLIAA